jgi:hypothetical protein
MSHHPLTHSLSHSLITSLYSYYCHYCTTVLYRDRKRPRAPELPSPHSPTHSLTLFQAQVSAYSSYQAERHVSLSEANPAHVSLLLDSTCRERVSERMSEENPSNNKKCETYEKFMKDFDQIKLLLVMVRRREEDSCVTVTHTHTHTHTSTSTSTSQSHSAVKKEWYLIIYIAHVE